jgi:hypothetical protein
MGRGSMSPLSLLIFSQRFMEGNESPKTSTTSLRLMPRSTASNTFSLSSLRSLSCQQVSVRLNLNATRR